MNEPRIERNTDGLFDDFDNQSYVAVLTHTDLDGYASGACALAGLKAQGVPDTGIAMVDYVEMTDAFNRTVNQMRTNLNMSLVVTDLSYKGDIEVEPEIGNRILWLDHHRDTLLNAGKLEEMGIAFALDARLCATEIAQQVFYTTSKGSISDRLTKMVRSRDLWLDDEHRREADVLAYMVDAAHRKGGGLPRQVMRMFEFAYSLHGQIDMTPHEFDTLRVEHAVLEEIYHAAKQIGGELDRAIGGAVQAFDQTVVLASESPLIVVGRLEVEAPSSDVLHRFMESGSESLPRGSVGLVVGIRDGQGSVRRTKGCEVSCREVAGLFGGGGHDAAAGFQLEGRSFEDVVETLRVRFR